MRLQLAELLLLVGQVLRQRGAVALEEANELFKVRVRVRVRVRVPLDEAHELASIK